MACRGRCPFWQAGVDGSPHQSWFIDRRGCCTQREGSRSRASPVHSNVRRLVGVLEEASALCERLLEALHPPRWKGLKARRPDVENVINVIYPHFISGPLALGQRLEFLRFSHGPAPRSDRTCKADAELPPLIRHGFVVRDFVQLYANLVSTALVAASRCCPRGASRFVAAGCWSAGEQSKVP